MLVLVTFSRQWDHFTTNQRPALSPCGQWEAGITCCFLCNLSGHYCVTLPTMSFWAAQPASPDQSEACIGAGLTNQRPHVILHLSPYIPPLKHSPALSGLGSPDVSTGGWHGPMSPGSGVTTLSVGDSGVSFLMSRHPAPGQRKCGQYRDNQSPGDNNKQPQS